MYNNPVFANWWFYSSVHFVLILGNSNYEKYLLVSNSLNKFINNQELGRNPLNNENLMNNILKVYVYVFVECLISIFPSTWPWAFWGYFDILIAFVNFSVFQILTWNRNEEMIAELSTLEFHKAFQEEDLALCVPFIYAHWCVAFRTAWIDGPVSARTHTWRMYFTEDQEIPKTMITQQCWGS